MATKRFIDGHEVVDDQPTAAPIKALNGQPVHWKQIRTLRLSNGDTVYGCAHCDYAANTPNSVRPHLNAHRNGRKSRHVSGDVEQVLAQLAHLDELTKDRDRWKQRALKAERDLRAIRRAIGGDL